MKKVVFDKKSEEFINATDVKNRAIIGYQRADLKGVLLYDEGQGKYIGASLVMSNGAKNDTICPYISQGLAPVVAVHSSTFMMKANGLNNEKTDFFTFENMADLLNWLLI